MCRIIFWNTNGKDLTNLVCELAASTAAEVVVLNEPGVAISDTLDALKTKVNQDFFLPLSTNEKRFHCFCRVPAFNLSEVHKGFRTSVRKLTLGQTPDNCTTFITTRCGAFLAIEATGHQARFTTQAVKAHMDGACLIR